MGTFKEPGALHGKVTLMATGSQKNSSFAATKSGRFNIPDWMRPAAASPVLA